MYHETIMSGIGGQGIMVIGTLLAQAAFLEDLNVTYMPTYGVEKRGGHADCTVVISSEEIGSPIVGAPQSCIVMSKSSLAKYAPRVKSGGLLLLNSSLMEVQEIPRRDLECFAGTLPGTCQEPGKRAHGQHDRHRRLRRQDRSGEPRLPDFRPRQYF